MSFAEDLMDGVQKEIELLDIILKNKNIELIEKPSGKFSGYDFQTYHKIKNEYLRIEVKYDRYNNQYIAIEFKCNGTISGAYTSRADYYFVFKNNKWFYSKTVKLIEIVVSNKYEVKTSDKDINYKTEFVLVPLEEFQEFKPNVIDPP